MTLVGALIGEVVLTIYGFQSLFCWMTLVGLEPPSVLFLRLGFRWCLKPIARGHENRRNPGKVRRAPKVRRFGANRTAVMVCAGVQ
jgi:hypothetical protein